VEPVKITFSGFAREWLEKYPKLAKNGPLKPSTIYGYRSIIQSHLLPFFGYMLLGRITTLTIERDFKAQLPETTGPTTAKNILILLQRMLESAVAWGYLGKNPFKGRSRETGVTIPRTEKKQHGRALKPEEIRTLLECCLDDAYPIVATAALTGMRRSEVFGLRLEDLDFEATQIHVRQTLYLRGEDQIEFLQPKSKTSIRSIDMGPKLRRILLEHRLKTSQEPNQFGLVCKNRKGGRVDPNNFVKRRFLPAVKAAGLGHMRFHDLRGFGAPIVRTHTFPRDLRFHPTG
jgi:integrase